MNVSGGVYKILLDPGGSGSHLQLEVGQAKWSTLIHWSRSVQILCSDWLRSWCCYASSLIS